MELPAENVVYIEDIERSQCGKDVDNVMLLELLEFQKKKNPKLKGMSNRDIAERCDMSESTLKNLLNGKNANPRIGTLKRLLTFIGGGSVDRLIGFAPPRNFEKESAAYDASLMDAMRHQVESLEAQNAAQEKELDRLRKLVLAKEGALCRLEGRAADVEHLTAQCADQRQRLEYKAQKIQEQAEEIAALKEKVEARDKTVANLEAMNGRQREELWWMKIGVVVLVTVIILAVGYFVWEIGNLDEGITAWLYPDAPK